MVIEVGFLLLNFVGGLIPGGMLAYFRHVERAGGSKPQTWLVYAAGIGLTLLAFGITGEINIRLRISDALHFAGGGLIIAGFLAGLWLGGELFPARK